MKDILDSLITKSQNIIADAMDRKMKNDICPECRKKMKTTIRESIVIDYIIHDCTCGFHREAFV